MSSVLSADVSLRPDAASPEPDVQVGARWAGRGAVALAFAAIAVIGLIDYWSPQGLSLSAFYLLPIVGATVAGGRRAGLAAALCGAAAALVSNDLLPAHAPATAISLWNASFRLVIFGIIVVLVDRGRRQAAAARAAERRTREFLASAAHQLRTPLAGIRSTVDTLLLDGDLDDHQEQLLITVTREASRAGRHLASLLRVARLDQHEPMPVRRLPLGPLLREELERAAARRPGLTWELQPGMDGTDVTCNPDAIGEAVANLLDNAGRHARTRVDASVGPSGDHVEVVVRDDGPGLPADLTEAVFRRFVSLDQHGGSGLGLPIARGLAEAHHGTLDYRDGGFVLRLPSV
jgi:signal transduction histidine kinase